jgi:hypothetical protein
VDLRWDQIELARANTYASASPGVFYYPDRKWQHVPDGMTYTFTREGAPQIDAREKPQTFQWLKEKPANPATPTTGFYQTAQGFSELPELPQEHEESLAGANLAQRG